MSRWLRQSISLLTAISNPKAPKEPAKNFSFDYSYWSHTTVSLNIVFVSIQFNDHYKNVSWYYLI